MRRAFVKSKPVHFMVARKQKNKKKGRGLGTRYTLSRQTPTDQLLPVRSPPPKIFPTTQ
jgi:hypothetical protein